MYTYICTYEYIYIHTHNRLRYKHIYTLNMSISIAGLGLLRCWYICITLNKEINQSEFRLFYNTHIYMYIIHNNSASQYPEVVIIRNNIETKSVIELRSVTNIRRHGSSCLKKFGVALYTINLSSRELFARNM